MGLSVDGVDGFAASMAAAADDLADMTEANTAAGRLIAGAAGQRVPRRTGRLAASQVVDPGPETLMVGYTAPYAQVIDHGWPARHIRATGFLTGTLADLYGDLSTLYTRQVARIIDTVHD
jgi:hypothetical protein